MVTYQEIVNTYLAYRNMRLSPGSKRDDVRMLMPFYIMDVSYQVYCRDIKDFECRHKVKIAKARWRNSYRSFNADFFRAFNSDQQDFIVDQMDEFENYIHNHVVMLKNTVMGVFAPEATFDEKKVLASVLTSNALAQMAQFVYSDMYRDCWHRKKNDPNIEAVIKQSYEFANNFPVSKGVDLTASDKVSAMIRNLCGEVMKFLNTKVYGTEN